MSYVKIITKAPEDVYGDDLWFLFLDSKTVFEIPGERLKHHQDGAFIHWSLLTDKERDLCWREYTFNR